MHAQIEINKRDCIGAKKIKKRSFGRNDRAVYAWVYPYRKDQVQIVGIAFSNKVTQVVEIIYIVVH